MEEGVEDGMEEGVEARRGTVEDGVEAWRRGFAWRRAWRLGLEGGVEVCVHHCRPPPATDSNRLPPQATAVERRAPPQ